MSRHNIKGKKLQINTITTKEELRVEVLKRMGYDSDKTLGPFDFIYKKYLEDYFNATNIVFPDGIVEFGTSTQDGNDILVDGWKVRLDQVVYEGGPDTINIPVTGEGNIRIDMVVMNSSGQYVLVQGNEVAEPGPAIAPNLPIDTVALFLVNSNDSGITSFINFALSAFVRFDADQFLNPIQRLQARNNIQALSKDTDDSRSGQLTQNGNIILNGVQATGAGTANFRLLSGRANNDSNHRILRIYNGLVVEENQLLEMTNRGGINFNVTIGGDWKFSDRGTVVLTIDRSGNIISTVRSNSLDTLIRRDENWLTYPVDTGGTGKLNNVELSSANGMIIFGSDVTEVSGIISNDLDEKELIIWSENPSGLILNGADLDSDLNNQFNETIQIGFRSPIKLVYRSGTLNKWVYISGIATINGSGVGGLTIEQIRDGLEALPNEEQFNVDFTRGGSSFDLVNDFYQDGTILNKGLNIPLYRIDSEKIALAPESDDTVFTEIFP